MLQTFYSPQLVLAINGEDNGQDNDHDILALLTDLSKAFDYLDHELSIEQLNAYRFSKPLLKLIHGYLSHRKQNLRINNSYSKGLVVLFGVPQASIL